MGVEKNLKVPHESTTEGKGYSVKPDPRAGRKKPNNMARHECNCSFESLSVEMNWKSISSSQRTLQKLRKVIPVQV